MQIGEMSSGEGRKRAHAHADHGASEFHLLASSKFTKKKKNGILLVFILYANDQFNRRKQIVRCACVIQYIE